MFWSYIFCYAFKPKTYTWEYFPAWVVYDLNMDIMDTLKNDFLKTSKKVYEVMFLDM